jgi:hypothetical protein
MYVKLGFAILAISLSLYGRQANSMSPTEAENNQLVSTTNPDIPPLKPIPGLYIDWETRLIHATGIGYGSEAAEPATRHLLALRAARANALKKLAAVIYGIHISPEQSIQNMIVLQGPENKVLRLKIEGLIKGSQEYQEPELLIDGGVQLHLVLPLSGLEKALELAQPISKQ